MKHRLAGPAVLAALTLTGFTTPATAADVSLPYSETFTGAATTPGDWLMVSPKGDTVPCLTAGTAAYDPAADQSSVSLPGCAASNQGAQADPPGQGAFQLTSDSAQDAGALILDVALNARRGLRVEFDQYQFGASTPVGADGISFFLIDGAVARPTVGEVGGTLGYQGMKGALVGIGFDQFGNFSMPADPDDALAPGRKPNSVVLRGSDYRYVNGVALDGPLALDRATSRSQAKRHTVIEVSAKGRLTLSIDFGEGPVTVFDDFNLPDVDELPTTVKLGFAASTGGSANFHQISNFTASLPRPDRGLWIDLGTDPGLEGFGFTFSLPLPPGFDLTRVKGEGWVCRPVGELLECVPGRTAPPLKGGGISVQTVPTGPFQAGGTGSATTTVGNHGSSASNGPVSVVIPAPGGLTIASSGGDGWTCAVSQDSESAACTRSDPLAARTAYPPIVTTFNVPGDAKGGVQVGGGTVTHGPDTDTAPPAEAPVQGAPGPDLKIDIGPGVLGGEIFVTVSNGSDGLGASGKINVTIPIPGGLDVNEFEGQDWSCAASEGTLMCTYFGGELPPGATLPPIILQAGLEAGFEWRAGGFFGSLVTTEANLADDAFRAFEVGAGGGVVLSGQVCLEDGIDLDTTDNVHSLNAERMLGAPAATTAAIVLPNMTYPHRSISRPGGLPGGSPRVRPALF